MNWFFFTVWVVYVVASALYIFWPRIMDALAGVMKILRALFWFLIVRSDAFGSRYDWGDAWRIAGLHGRRLHGRRLHANAYYSKETYRRHWRERSRR